MVNGGVASRHRMRAASLRTGVASTRRRSARSPQTWRRRRPSGLEGVCRQGMPPRSSSADPDPDRNRPQMSKDHYVPAALIGRFSNETSLPARRRRIYVARADKVFPARPEDVGYRRNLYTLDPGPAGPDVDRVLN